jgi:hypothetical protein
MTTLTVADVARVREVGRVAAYRWLQRNAARWLRRDGRLVVISAEHYALAAGLQMDPRVEQRFAALEERVDEVERRLDAHVRRAS